MEGVVVVEEGRRGRRRWLWRRGGGGRRKWLLRRRWSKGGEGWRWLLRRRGWMRGRRRWLLRRRLSRGRGGRRWLLRRGRRWLWKRGGRWRRRWSNKHEAAVSPHHLAFSVSWSSSSSLWGGGITGTIRLGGAPQTSFRGLYQHCCRTDAAVLAGGQFLPHWKRQLSKMDPGQDASTNS